MKLITLLGLSVIVVITSSCADRNQRKTVDEEPNKTQWQSSEIGKVETESSYSINEGYWTIKTSGKEFKGTNDNFLYIHKTLVGDGEITARIVQLKDDNETVSPTTAGVMIRESLDPNAVHGITVIHPQEGSAFLRRRVIGDEYTHSPGPSVKTPNWVRLIREGDSIKSYVSEDKVNWILIDKDVIAMQETVYVGIAVTSNNEGKQGYALIEKVETSNDLLPDLYVSVFEYLASANVAPGVDVASLITIGLSNIGTADAGPFHAGIYLSIDSKIEPNDILLEGGASSFGGIQAMSSIVSTGLINTSAITIPEFVKPGNYYIGILIDDQQVITESNEMNNYKSKSIIIKNKPDLIVEAFHCERGAAGYGQIIGDHLSLQIRNNGPVKASAFSVGIYLSTDKVITSSDVLLTSGSVNVGSLGANISSQVLLPHSITTPSSGLTPGKYFIGALVDNNGIVVEDSESNNYASQSIVITNRTWTVLGYFAGDCNREWQAITNLAQLEQANTAGTSIMVATLLDRNPKTGHGFSDIHIPTTSPYGDWTETRWGPVIYDGDPKKYSTGLSPLRNTQPELNTGDPNVFVEYIQRAMLYWPAQHYAIWFYDHGNMGGFGQDDTSGKDGLTMAELHSAFDKIPFVDIVLYDACLMQDIEVVTELVDDVEYVVASQNNRWGKNLGSNIYMDKALQWLIANPNTSAKQFALQIFKQDMHSTSHGGDCSVVDVSLIPKLNDAVDNFATVSMNLGKLEPSQWTHLGNSRNSVKIYSPWNTYIDFWGYLDNVIKNTQIKKNIRDAASVAHDLLDPIKKKVIIAQKGNGSGLSVFMPKSGCNLSSAYNGNNYTFCDLWDKDGTRWRQFLLNLPGPCTPNSQTLIDEKKDRLGNSMNEAHLLGDAEVTTWLSSNIISTSDVDFVKFNASEGYVLHADLYGNPLSEGLIPVLSVYNPNREMIFQVPGNEEGLATTGTPLPLPEEGDFYIAISSEGNLDPINPVEGESIGMYTLVVNYGRPEIINPDLIIDEKVVNFGKQTTGSWSHGNATVNLTNRGLSSLIINELILADDSPFITPVNITLPITIGPRSSMDLRININPTRVGRFIDTLHIITNDPAQSDFKLVLLAEGVKLWDGSDIGDMRSTGSHYLDNDMWIIEGSGLGIGDQNDAFHYVYQPVIGDCEIFARIVYLKDAEDESESKVGVMFRETLHPNSAYTMTMVTPQMNSAYLCRLSEGGESRHKPGPSEVVAKWIRLIREGDIFISYISMEGKNWVPLGREIVPMEDTVYVGMAVSGESEDMVSNVVIDNVSIVVLPR